MDTAKTEAITRIKANWKDVAPDEKYEIGLLRPGDGQGVVQLFYTVYGDRYPVADYYLPERVEALNASGEVFTVVARLNSGAIAGQGAYYQSSPPNKALYEVGQLLVAPEYRNTAIAVRIAQAMDRLSRTITQAQGFFGESVCSHLVTQKLSLKQGYCECGLELSLMPAGSYEKEGAGAERVSCLLAVRVERDRRACPAPARVLSPGAGADTVRLLSRPGGVLHRPGQAGRGVERPGQPDVRLGWCGAGSGCGCGRRFCPAPGRTGCRRQAPGPGCGPGVRQRGPTWGGIRSRGSSRTRLHSVWVGAPLVRPGRTGDAETLCQAAVRDRQSVLRKGQGPARMHPYRVGARAGLSIAICFWERILQAAT